MLSIPYTIENLIASVSDTIFRVFIVQDRYQLWLTGLQNTLVIAFFALWIGLILGFLLAVLRVVHDATPRPPVWLRVLNRLAKIYISIIRGVPMVVQLMIFNFIILAASRNGVLIGILAFGFNSSAYVAEIFRAGILSVDKGQMEAGRSLGLSYAQTMRKIIMPQAIKNSIPTLGNEFITVLKETSIAGQVAIMDITRAGAVIRGLTYNPSPLIFVALIYLVMVLFLEFVVGRIERRLRRSDQR
ncbi:MAG: amino acid ABC transporter permease [Oscillospiraceae bacterium]|nr:amino acid ABC transporter permease [Oscillospiraceae bacterium]